MNKSELQDLEIKVLLETIYQRYDYDFRLYSPASIKRRIEHYLGKTDFNNISEMIPSIIYDKSFFESLFYTISIPVTEMFRDPHVFKAIRKEVVPVLKTYPFIKVWIAGCATGEEAYSLAILLKEEGLYDRCQIYATDFNDEALSKAKKGIYPIDKIRQYTENYRKSGGKNPFSNYFQSQYGSVVLDTSLKKNIVFANYNFTTDTIFGEMNLIMCRNVMIYFNKTLQNLVFKLFHESLSSKGFLCIGSKESMSFSDISGKFKQIAKEVKIFSRVD